MVGTDGGTGKAEPSKFSCISPTPLRKYNASRAPPHLRSAAATLSHIGE
jgi:hypothetical protein